MGTISKAYGVLKEDEGLAFRGLFLIDPSGKLRQITVNDLPVGRDVDETLRLLQAFQFTDKHGEVCPLDGSQERQPWFPIQKEVRSISRKPTLMETNQQFFKSTKLS